MAIWLTPTGLKVLLLDITIMLDKYLKFQIIFIIIFLSIHMNDLLYNFDYSLVYLRLYVWQSG